MVFQCGNSLQHFNAQVAHLVVDIVVVPFLLEHEGTVETLFGVLQLVDHLIDAGGETDQLTVHLGSFFQAGQRFLQVGAQLLIQPDMVVRYFEDAGDIAASLLHLKVSQEQLNQVLSHLLFSFFTGGGLLRNLILLHNVFILVPE